MKSIVTLDQFLLCLTLVTLSQFAYCTSDTESIVGYSGEVEDWWNQCSNAKPESSCLTDSEISKFKTLCANENNHEDCDRVIDHQVAKARLSEAKKFLTSGVAAQKNYYASEKKYLSDIAKIWKEEAVHSARSFAVGLLPSCNSKESKKLLFGENLRPEVAERQKQLLYFYEKLSNIPCPDEKSGFVLVAIGSVHDSFGEVDIFTVDSNSNFKTIRTSLNSGPFNQLADLSH